VTRALAHRKSKGFSKDYLQKQSTPRGSPQTAQEMKERLSSKHHGQKGAGLNQAAARTDGQANTMTLPK